MATIEQCEGAKYASYMREIDRIEEEAWLIEAFMPELETLQAAAERLKESLKKVRDILEGILELEKELAEVEK